MDILIINPGKIRHDYVTEHLGIASLKSFVLSRGFSADTLDMSVEKLSVREGVLKTLSIKPKIVGVSLLNDSAERGIELVRELRQQGYTGPVIAGGYFATFAAQEILRDFPEIDYVVQGEGELTLAELLERLLRGKNIPLKEVQGLSYRKNGAIIDNPARPLIEDLDILPPPDRKYAPVVLKHGSNLRVYGTRGCWGQCTFCDIVGMYRSSPGKVWRSRSVKKLVDEIEELQHRFGTDYFAFNDDQFLLRGKPGLERVREFASEIRRRNLKIQFELMCRADTVDRRTMSILKEAGLQRVFIGLESFDQKQLQRFRKGISVRQNLKAVITLYRLKIDVLASLILADAYTTFLDIIHQFIVLYELRRRYFNSPQCRISLNRRIEIYRGSPLYREYKQAGLLTRDHYLHGYDYRMKFLTRLRLKLFDLEAALSRLLFQPLASLRIGFRTVRWSLSHIRLNLFFTK